MKNLKLLLTILILLMYSCQFNPSSKQNEQSYDFIEIIRDSVKEMTAIDGKSITIEVPDKFETLDIDKTIKEMKYVPLETNVNSLIGRIDKLEIHENFIYVLDKSFAQAIYIFEMNGHHVHTISKKGNGPEEYIQIVDFCFQNDTLVVYDGIGAKLLFFTEKGDYLSKSKTAFHFRNFTSFTNDDYLIMTYNAPNSFLKEISHYSVLIGKPDSIVKYKGFENNLFLEQFEHTNNNPLVGYNGTHLISPLLSNFIYQINADGSYFPKYRINFKNSLPLNYYELTTVKEFNSYIKKNKISYFMGTFFENDEHLFLRFNPPGNFFGYIIFNKKTTIVSCYDGTYSSENKYWGLSTPHCVYNNYFVGSIDPINVCKNKKRLLQNHHMSQVNKEILYSISENDNPILIFFSFI